MNRSDEEAVRDLIARVNHAWLAKDFAGLGDCFSQSAVMVGPGFEVLGRGRDFFVQSYRDFAQSAAVIHYSETDPLLEIVEDVAICVYGWTMSYEREGVASTERGTDQFVLCRAGADWQVLWRCIRFEPAGEGAP
jgi:uncharacterized protein (TIGR02246 family)